MMVTTAVIALAIVAGWLLYKRSVRNPWTRDGRVNAEVVMLTPRVTGHVLRVGVVDNQFVEAGDLLFEIDPIDFELAVESATASLADARQQVDSLSAAVDAAVAGLQESEAAVATAKAQVASAQAVVDAYEAKVDAAEANVKSAQSMIDQREAEYEQSIRDRDRAQKLAKDGAGSVSRAESQAAGAEAAQAALEGAQAGLEKSQADLVQAQADLAQSQANLVTAEASLSEADARLASAHADLAKARADLGPPGEANPKIQSAKVALAQAELDLKRTRIVAPADGYITNLNVDVGDYASEGANLLAFVDVATFHVLGFFRETQLGHIDVGDRAVITLLSNRNKRIEGEVESIGWAINPPNVANIEGADGIVPQIEPSFDWIRLAQRVPVRIRLDEVPDDVTLVSGTTVSVVIRPN